MKKLNFLLLVIMLNTPFSEIAMAQNKQPVLVPLPSLEDFSKGDNGLAIGLGLGVEYESAYEGSDEFGIEVDPAGAVQWRQDNDIFYWAGEALGWRGLRAKNWLFDVAVSFDEGREESDSDDGYLDGLGNGDEGLEFVLQLRTAFDSDWRYWLDGRVVTGEDGSLGLLGFGTRFGEHNDGSGHELAIAVVFHDSDYANKDFGISLEQSKASGLNETVLEGGFRSVGINYHYRHIVNENWQVFGEAVYERYSSDIEISPIARANYEAEIGIGFIYVF